MEESVTYQAIIRRGEAQGMAQGKRDGVREVIYRQGTKRFGVPNEATRQMLDSVSDLERLERLSERLLDVESWTELLAEN